MEKSSGQSQCRDISRPIIDGLGLKASGLRLSLEATGLGLDLEAFVLVNIPALAGVTSLFTVM